LILIITGERFMGDGSTSVSHEREVRVANGGLMLALAAILLFLSVGSFVVGVREPGGPLPSALFAAVILAVLCVLTLVGLFTLQPNEARVLVLFGSYRGTVRRAGFHWGNPFYSNGNAGFVVQMPGQRAAGSAPPSAASRKNPRMKISLRARNLNTEHLKVNDRQGNPIEIAAVVVWRVADTAQAMFDVDDYEDFVRIQSETAVRHLCSQYAYDNADDDGVTLRSGADEVAHALQEELQTRLARAGVRVEEARLTHLAYAPEVAQAMLRRQQAEAVLAARAKIVKGAVGMVEMALSDLAKRNVVDLDPERKAAMVSNLMVVLCGETEARPVINTGTLYS
jgi:regulator of protease activity HflC (stomatin/prohibitin superfamily)